MNGAVCLGYLSPRAKELAKVWKELIDEMGGVDSGGLIIHYAHSIGGAETYRAQFLLSDEEKKMIQVITVGTALLIPDVGFESVCNYVSTKDPVPMTDLFRYIKAKPHTPSHIVFLPSLSGSLPTDHLLLSATYNNLMKQLGQEFCRLFMPAAAI